MVSQAVMPADLREGVHGGKYGLVTKELGWAKSDSPWTGHLPVARPEQGSNPQSALWQSKLNVSREAFWSVRSYRVFKIEAQISCIFEQY